MLDDFVGLSYEVRQLADPSFFSAQNGGLIRAFKALSSTGVLRLGATRARSLTGNLHLILPNQSILKSEVVGEPKVRYYTVTSEAVSKLSEFLQATGWTCIYGVGMGTNTEAPTTWSRLRMGSSLQARSAAEV
jgi:hypothetical protein